MTIWPNWWILSSEKTPLLVLIGDSLWNRFGEDEIKLEIRFSSEEDELDLWFFLNKMFLKKKQCRIGYNGRYSSLIIHYSSFLNGRVNKKWELKRLIFKSRNFLAQTRVESFFFALIWNFIILIDLFFNIIRSTKILSFYLMLIIKC